MVAGGAEGGEVGGVGEASALCERDDVVDFKVVGRSALLALVLVACSCGCASVLPCAAATGCAVRACVSAAAASSFGEEGSAAVGAEVGVGHVVFLG